MEGLTVKRRILRVIAALAALAALLAALSGCGKKGESLYAEIVVQDYGTILVELNKDQAPISVENFVKLANEHFYDGLTFHRIMKGFMMQGGASNNDGSGGSEATIKGEFKQNGVQNSISHVRGTISMARADAFDSASSQFFIVHQDSTGLDGLYAAFGKVIKGMEIVDEICENTPVVGNNGKVMPENQPIISTVTILTNINDLQT